MVIVIHMNKDILRRNMLTLNAGWNDVVQKSVTTKKVRSDKVALLCIRSDTRDIYLDVNDLKDTSFDGTI